MKRLAAATLGFALLSIAAPALAQTGPREYPVRSPPHPHVVPEYTRPMPEGAVEIRDNMPGHRRFKNPLWPNAGWDSPTLPDGSRNYAHYIVEYWRAPSLPDNAPVDDWPGLSQRGYINRQPDVRVSRSRATPEEEALFERRARLIVERILATRPIRNLHGASLEPVVAIKGYGQEHGARGSGVMEAEIELRFRVLQPYTGTAERMPDGTMRSTHVGPYITIKLNPQMVWCGRPSRRTAITTECAGYDHHMAADNIDALFEMRPNSGIDYLMLKKSGYARNRPSTDIQAMVVAINSNDSMDGSNLDRGRMHPHHALGRLLGVTELTDWNELRMAANAVE
ncbi:MAG: hypothetical protein EON91_12770 [Brevundimonas sp.]|uniref:hypothetical protein n=1 Tax=Brevundimonas sp. TaxID=1871086 RepID=UPI00121CB50C|nr:hypothetical protein [Brevundimonas sp.]RZJ16561.1 MAG: hypothetical protein EON91_12770 [Brevundimonas sp.]